MVLLFSCSLVAQNETDTPLPKQNPYASEADLARGKQLFGAQCAPCHGPAGAGGRGANLARPKLPRAPDDPSLFRTIRDGIEGTEMPGAWVLNEHETWQVAAFVRSLGRTEIENGPGNPGRGRELVASKGGCLRCHSIGGEGGRMGPPLTGVGSRRNAAFLRAKLLDPSASIPDGFLYVDAVTRQGRRISGTRLNEDTWSIQIRDLGDGLHSLWKQDLAELKRDRSRSPMPAFRSVFSDAELDDVVAYLVSLRGDL